MDVLGTYALEQLQEQFFIGTKVKMALKYTDIFKHTKDFRFAFL